MLNFRCSHLLIRCPPLQYLEYFAWLSARSISLSMDTIKRHF